MPRKLEWRDNGPADAFAQSEFGIYEITRAKIRHGRTYETEWRVYIRKPGVTGLQSCESWGGTKKEGKQIAQEHYEEQQSRAALDTNQEGAR